MDRASGALDATAELASVEPFRGVWSPAAQTLPTDADRAVIAAMDGRRFGW